MRLLLPQLEKEREAYGIKEVLTNPYACYNIPYSSCIFFIEMFI